jgi:hypothetical protein
VVLRIGGTEVYLQEMHNLIFSRIWHFTTEYQKKTFAAQNIGYEKAGSSVLRDAWKTGHTYLIPLPCLLLTESIMPFHLINGIVQFDLYLETPDNCLDDDGLTVTGENYSIDDIKLLSGYRTNDPMVDSHFMTLVNSNSLYYNYELYQWQREYSDLQNLNFKMTPRGYSVKAVIIIPRLKSDVETAMKAGIYEISSLGGTTFSSLQFRYRGKVFPVEAISGAAQLFHANTQYFGNWTGADGVTFMYNEYAGVSTLEGESNFAIFYDFSTSRGATGLSGMNITDANPLEVNISLSGTPSGTIEWSLFWVCDAIVQIGQSKATLTI